jgi:hypothetical protein
MPDRITQHKDESLLWAADFGPDLNGASITDGSAVAEEGDIVVTGGEIEGTLVRFGLSGGAPGKRYKIKLTAETDAPETLVKIVPVYIYG